MSGKKSKKKPITVSIPVMITVKMRIQLLELGFNNEQIKHLKPAEALAILEKLDPKPN